MFGPMFVEIVIQIKQIILVLRDYESTTKRSNFEYIIKNMDPFLKIELFLQGATANKY